LTLQLINADLLREILETNQVSDTQKEMLLFASQQIQKLQAENHSFYVCNLDLLERFTSEEFFEDENLSEICGKKIILTKEQQRKMIDSLLQSQLYQENKIIFTSFNYLNAIPENLSIFVQEDGFVAAWNVKKYHKRLYCLNLDVISGFYRYIDDLKNTIPKICWDKNWKEKQLRRIRESL